MPGYQNMQDIEEDKSIREKLLNIHRQLKNFFGPLFWWPGDSKLEIIVGAILTQNTNWQNVTKAINNIKKQNLLKAKELYNINEKDLAQLIKPSGYYNLKAKRLKNFINYFYRSYDGSIEEIFKHDCSYLRGELLRINGIGQETADSILLYAGEKPVFVVDAYTRRIFQRHKMINPDSNKDSYENIQAFFMNNLPQDHNLFNEFHAQIVMVGKNYCKPTKPDCHNCPLSNL